MKNFEVMFAFSISKTNEKTSCRCSSARTGKRGTICTFTKLLAIKKTSYISSTTCAIEVTSELVLKLKAVFVCQFLPCRFFFLVCHFYKRIIGQRKRFNLKVEVRTLTNLSLRINGQLPLFSMNNRNRKKIPSGEPYLEWLFI